MVPALRSSLSAKWSCRDSVTSQERPRLVFPPANGVSLLSTDKRIYRLPVFTAEFCQALVDELENFEQSDMPKGRPNTMNNYGVGFAASCASLGDPVDGQAVCLLASHSFPFRNIWGLKWSRGSV